MSKYSPIYHFLKKQSDTELTLSFSRIEQIISDKLPMSDFKYREWWSNEQVGSHVQAQNWMAAGWEVDSVNLSSQIVQFRKVN